jgi:DNA helicase HerA-like ATPase
VGEALISLLDETGTPGEVQRGFVVPPASRVGPISTDERQQVIRNSVLFGHYEKAVDRESAYERLKGRAQSAPVQPPQSAPLFQSPSPVAHQPSAQPSGTSWTDSIGSILGQFGGGGRREGMAEALAKSAARAIGSQVGRQIVRGVLGGILGGSTSRRRY